MPVSCQNQTPAFSGRSLLLWHRAVLAGVPFCIAAVILVARPSFLFGGVGLRSEGVMVAAWQARSI